MHCLKEKARRRVRAEREQSKKNERWQKINMHTVASHCRGRVKDWVEQIRKGTKDGEKRSKREEERVDEVEK